MTIELKHRFGSHGGIATEWELYSEEQHIRNLIRQLPIDLFPVQHSNQGEYRIDENRRFRSFIFLPEGLNEELVGRIAVSLAEGLDLDELIRLLRKCQKIGKSDLEIK